MNKDIKICTMTHHTVLNYGAVLQAYALQKAIEKIGYSSEVLDYDSERAKKVYITSLSQVRTLKHLIKYVFFPYDKRRKRKIQNFITKNIIISKEKYSRNDLSKANNKYDLFIVGSDQVWNMRLHEGDTSYMLDFLDDTNKKGSYAASFGYNVIPSEYKNTTKKYISDFKYLNIREEQGKNIIKELTGKESNVVLDPTFLLNKEDYIDIEDEKSEKKESYVLLYNLTKSSTIVEFAKNLAKENGCNLIVINTDVSIVIGGKNIRDASPEKFISLIKNAKFVVTSSFHGVAFSLIFNKQFFYELNNNTVNNNSRLQHIASLLNLESREIGKLKGKNDFPNIDYIKVNAKLNELKNYSVGCLREMIVDSSKGIYKDEY